MTCATCHKVLSTGYYFAGLSLCGTCYARLDPADRLASLRRALVEENRRLVAECGAQTARQTLHTAVYAHGCLHLEFQDGAVAVLG